MPSEYIENYNNNLVNSQTNILTLYRNKISSMKLIDSKQLL